MPYGSHDRVIPPLVTYQGFIILETDKEVQESAVQVWRRQRGLLSENEDEVLHLVHV